MLGLDVGRVTQVEHAAGVLLERRMRPLVERVRHQRPHGRGVPRIRRADFEAVGVEARPDALTGVARLQGQPAALQQLPRVRRHCGGQTAQHRVRHEQPDVERPTGDDAIDAVGERCHDRFGSDQRDHPLRRLDVAAREPRGQAGPVTRRYAGHAVIDAACNVRRTQLGPDHRDLGIPALLDTQIVELPQAAIEVDVCAGDADGEHERDAVLARSPQIGADVRGDIGRDLLA